MFSPVVVARAAQKWRFDKQAVVLIGQVNGPPTGRYRLTICPA